MKNLERRLETLESRTPKVDGEQALKFAAAVSALFDAVGTRALYVDGLQDFRSGMDFLWQRLQAGTTTEADRAMLDGLPKTHVTPEKLVEAVMQVQGKY
ncbi:MAG: hypothetical protein JWP93_2329 [Polaromonas sp.]|nr:hypothetical protein [Polaromonas sp.]